MKKVKGFTLIELLIVVAIIAILAAIAVPNFLEAQVRAKVSRAKADIRTIATGMEAYCIDYNKYIPGANAFAPVRNAGQKGACGLDTTVDATNREWCWSLLTTPLAYLSSIPSDPFRDKGAVNKKGAGGGTIDTAPPKYVYDAYDCTAFWSTYPTWPAAKAFKLGYRWALISIGPSRNSGSGGSANIVIGIVYDASGGTLFHYDPSNGTVSSGYMIRTNKGDFNGPDKYRTPTDPV